MEGWLAARLRAFSGIRPLPLPSHSRVAAVADRIDRMWASLQAPPIAGFELEEYAHRIREHWEREQTLSDLPKRDLRWLAWVLCYPPEGRERWLAQSAVFLESYGELLRTSGRPSQLLQFLRVFLLKYPTDLETFDRWRQLLKKLLLRSQAPRVKVWVDRCGEYEFLERNAPARLAQLLAESPDPEGLLQQSGLEGELRQAGLVRCAIEELARAIGRDFTEKKATPAQVERLRGLLLVEGAFRFSESKGELARALLLPFAPQNPEPEIEAALLRLFFSTLGDPRIRPASGWIGVGEDCLSVVRRWLARTSIEYFFALIRETARKGQWEYRERFWRAFLDAGVVSDAWVALGRRALERRTVTPGEAELACGYLGGSGVSTQSVLLLRIRHLIFAEWSHDGACRAWSMNRESVPKLYQPSYRAATLQWGEDDRFPHNGSAQGSWQSRIARYIYHQTGIIVSRSKYFA